MSSGVKVSLCMIVKNEETDIKACIQSVKNLVDEIVIVDTGSEDKTREAAIGEGAMVHDYFWNSNFADARNFGLEQANGNWILVLDADERLDDIDGVYFQSLLEAGDMEGYYFTIRSYVDSNEKVSEDYVVRLFRNKPEYRFSGAIHEQVIGSIKSNVENGVGFANITVEHYGYLSTKVTAKNKQKRNVEVIKKALADNPHDPYLLYSLGIEYMQSERLAESVQQFETALRFLTGGEGYFSSVVVRLGVGLLRLNEQAKLTDVLEKGLIMLPDNSDLHLLKGMQAFLNNEYEVTIEEVQPIVEQQSEIITEQGARNLLGNAYRLAGR
ncbi:MAG: glycosyl transferase family 2 [Firmicutes bacterium]|nr:glycosyl transferase family 2 [Bacillota bacterium]